MIQSLARATDKSGTHVNMGIAMIKIIACLAVVSLHFGGNAFGRRLAVPIFMFLAFYLSAKHVTADDWSRLLKRLRRLFVPFAFWGLVAGAQMALSGCKVSLWDVVLQLTTGCRLCGHLWYLSALLLFTAGLFVLNKYIKSWWRTFILGVSVIACFGLQYSGVNYRVFAPITSKPWLTIARLVEVWPIAVAGLAFARYYKDIEKRGVRWTIFSLSCIGLIISGGFMVSRLPSLPMGFGYQGLAPFGMSVALSIIFVIIGDLYPGWGGGKCGKLIGMCGSLTGGIYFCHVAVGTELVRLTGLGKSHFLMGLVFLGSLCFAWLLSRFKYTSWMVK